MNNREISSPYYASKINIQEDLNNNLNLTDITTFYIPPYSSRMKMPFEYTKKIKK